jgi:hypothetical protein
MEARVVQVVVEAEADALLQLQIVVVRVVREVLAECLFTLGKK